MQSEGLKRTCFLQISDNSFIRTIFSFVAGQKLGPWKKWVENRQLAFCTNTLDCTCQHRMLTFIKWLKEYTNSRSSFVAKDNLVNKHYFFRLRLMHGLFDCKMVIMNYAQFKSQVTKCPCDKKAKHKCTGEDLNKWQKGGS